MVSSQFLIMQCHQQFHNRKQLAYSIVTLRHRVITLILKINNYKIITITIIINIVIHINFAASTLSSL